MEQRRFSRFKIVEKCFVDYRNGSSEVTLKDISLKGAMVEFKDSIPVTAGEGVCLSFPLGHSDKYLQFNAEIIHAQGRIAGMRFFETDLGTLFDLHSLLMANTGNIELLKREFDCVSNG